MSVQHIISLLSVYKYAILFPLAVFEGPFATVIAGFLSNLGVLNLFFVYPILILGDVTGDAAFYGLGRWGSRFINKHGAKVGLTEDKINQARNYFQIHRGKALFFSKILHGIGIAGLVAAGSLKIPYRKFFVTCFTISAMQSFLLLLIGFYFGRAYNLIGDYLNYYTSGVIIFVVFAAAVVLIKKFNFLKS